MIRSVVCAESAGGKAAGEGTVWGSLLGFFMAWFERRIAAWVCGKLELTAVFIEHSCGLAKLTRTAISFLDAHVGETFGESGEGLGELRVVFFEVFDEEVDAGGEGRGVVSRWGLFLEGGLNLCGDCFEIVDILWGECWEGSELVVERIEDVVKSVVRHVDGSVLGLGFGALQSGGFFVSAGSLVSAGGFRLGLFMTHTGLFIECPESTSDDVFCFGGWRTIEPLVCKI